MAAVTPAAAQRTTGEIIGKVIDESGGVLPGVTVTLRGPAIQGAQTDVTSETGTYRFPVLPPGTYELEYVLPGFGTVKREGIQIAVGSTVELEVALKVSSLEETITVTGDAPVVNTATSQVSTAYNKEWVQNAPVRRFSYFDLINSAPGVSQTSNLGTTTSATSLGSSTNENQYQIDGTVIGSTPWPNTDSVEEVEVLQLGASAEYGNVQGAVFNIVTRQGGNVLHGDANIYIQTNGLVSRNTTDAIDGGRPYHLDTYRDATVQASGPFIRDKFWFFGSLQYQRVWDSQPGTDPKFPAKSDAQRMFWKFNYSINDRHRLLHGYHDDFYYLPAIGDAFTAPSTLSQSHGHNPTPNVVYTGVLTNRTFLEARFSGFWLQSSTDPQVDGQPRIGLRYTDQDTSLVTGAISEWRENRSWQYGPSIKLTHFVDRFMGGSHDLKTGYAGLTNGNVNLNGPNDTITTYSRTGRQTTGTTRLPYYAGTRSATWGVYLDDTYRVGTRVTANLGLRYDYSRGYYVPLPMVDAQGNPTGQTSAGNDNVYDYRVVSPRLGLNYKIAPQTVFKAHYGRYYSALERDFGDLVPSTTTQFTFNVSPTGARSNFTSTAPRNFRVDPERKAPYSDQYIVQIEQGLAQNLGLQVNYVHKRGEDFSGSRDIAGQYVLTPFVDSPAIGGPEATGQTLMLYRLVSPASERIFLLTTPGGLYSRYNGATFMLTKRMSNNWQGVISLVLSKAEGRLASSARSGPRSAQSSAAGSFGQDAAGPNDYVNTEGRLIGDKPVVAKAQVVYRFPYGFMAAVNVQHQTGRLWSRQARFAGLGFPAQPTINLEANTGDRRVADVNVTDLRVQKSVTLRGSSRIELFLDALNLTNNASNEDVASSLGTAAGFGVPTRIILPRRMQLGAKIVW
jgi:hypothetical protein